MLCVCVCVELLLLLKGRDYNLLFAAACIATQRMRMCAAVCAYVLVVHPTHTFHSLATLLYSLHTSMVLRRATVVVAGQRR